jgi:aquaporin Z
MLPHKHEYKPLQRYLMEALGLGLFMVSIAIFGTYLLSPNSNIQHIIPNERVRIFALSIFMAATALFITTSPATSPSGAHINPAVTLCFLRLGRISKKDAFFYILFQTAGATIAVYVMAVILKDNFICPPVNYAVTQPGQFGVAVAFLTEFLISAVLMLLVLFGNDSKKIQRHLPFYIAGLILFYVNVSVLISGFSMNAARSFASALPSGIWKFYWLYCIAPVTGMLLATEYYRRRKIHKNDKEIK